MRASRSSSRGVACGNPSTKKGDGRACTLTVVRFVSMSRAEMNVSGTFSSQTVCQIPEVGVYFSPWVPGAACDQKTYQG